MKLSRNHSFQWAILAFVATGFSHAGCEREAASPQRTVSSDVESAATPLGRSTPSSHGDGQAAGVPSARTRIPTIVAFGDSLTAGFGVPPDDSYPARLQRRLDELGFRYRVINAGVSGDTTAGGLRRVDWALKSHPDLVILELGGNDGLRGLNLDQTRANLEGIILRLKQAGVTTVLAGMKLPPNYGQDYTARFESMYRELAVQHDLPFIPFLLDGVGGDRTLNQADGIHPTSDGYRIVVDNVLETLKPLLEHQHSDGKERGKNRSAPLQPAGAMERR